MNFDDNQWYHIYNGDKDNSLVGTYLFDNSSLGDITVGSVFKNRNKIASNERTQKWQIVSVDDGYNLFRTAAGGPEGFLATYFAPNRVNLTGSTLVRMVRGNVSDDSVYWKVTPWGDGTYYLTNKVNGTQWHVGYGGETDSDDGTEAQMQSNITAIQTRQRFSFEPISAINNGYFERSSLTLPGTSQPTSPPATSTGSTPITGSTTGSSQSDSTGSSASGTSLSDASTPSGGLSTGAKAGIGAAVGIVAIIALVVLGLFLVRRRKRRTPSPVEAPNPQVHQEHIDENGYDASMIKYGHYGVPEKAELPNDVHRHELPTVNPVPAELHGEAAPTRELPGEEPNRRN